MLKSLSLAFPGGSPAEMTSKRNASVGRTSRLRAWKHQVAQDHDGEGPFDLLPGHFPAPMANGRSPREVTSAVIKIGDSLSDAPWIAVS